jgi:hypothetical protein
MLTKTLKKIFAIKNPKIDLTGNLRFAPPFHYELQTDRVFVMKRQGVRNGKTGCSERVVRNVGHPI